jgi:MoaA/NifB/PqqE/SkfB family radical SAM enzyme
MTKICHIPFTEIKCGDVLSPCCSAWLNTESLNIDMLRTNMSASDIWKNNYSEFRRSILDGSYKFCSTTCPNKVALSNGLTPSLEQSHPDIYNKIIIDPDSIYPHNITLTYDATCNLVCKSCRTTHIKSDPSNVAKLFNVYAPILKDCTELTISGDGDAFASPHYFSLLQSDLTDFAPKLNKITIQTNGLLFTQANYEKIHPTNKKLIRLISISIDAASEEVYKATRGGNFSILCKNLEYIKHLKETASDWLCIYSGYTISKNNISDAINFIDFAHKYDFNMIQYWLVRDWARANTFESITIDTNSTLYKEVRDTIKERIEPMKKESLEIKWMISDTNIESNNETPKKTLPVMQKAPRNQISTNPIINQSFLNDDNTNVVSQPLNIQLNNNIPKKRYAIYCPFYITDQNLGHWIDNWISNVTAYEDADKYYTLSYPENFDVSKYDEILQKLNSVATCIKSDSKIYHTHALEISHNYLKERNYDYMLHIEQDVILNAPIGKHLINKIIEDDNDVLITDIKGLEIFDGESDIDISVFVINLHSYDSTSYHTYISSDNIKTFDLVDHSLYNIGDYKTIPPILTQYSNLEIYNTINTLLNTVYNKTNLIHWVHTYMSNIKVDNAVNPVFVDSARGYPIHAYMNNKLSIAYGMSSYAKHLKQSRTSYITTRIDINTIINRFGYQPIGEDSPNKHINLDAYFSKGLDIVIISKNQKQSIKKMLDILKFDIPTANRIFVLDRCTDGSKELLESQHEFFIERNDAVGFCAGSARNIGLKHTNPEHDVLFLDGDRIPHNLNYERIVQMLYYFNISMIKNEKDTRNWFVNIPSINTQMTKSNNNVWSSAILLRRTAINKISEIVGDGNLFDPIFDGNWGCEDEYLGDVAISLGMLSGGFPSTIYVEGETTVSNTSSPEYMSQVSKRTELKQKLSSSHQGKESTYMDKAARRAHIENFLKHRERLE